ncbi:MAG: phosphoribosylanthranilate isomerase [Dethiobacter sp.]|jgi:phosphoribosylanthranilate isomerase|nr:phosphoribosylanthranilate isomerase [Dethiobacter sp.]MBS3990362.1 phosphoribosylanthranilate isomerase [Dethiobacter sp.]
MTRIKICGIVSLDEALCCVRAGADALGFVFAQSPRQVEPLLARQITASLPPFVQRVGVFVNAERTLVEQIAFTAGLTALQFHGQEGADYCNSFSLPVIKAVAVKSAADISGIDEFPVAAILLDTFDPQLAGGTGRTFNWGVVESGLKKPVVLAGGLHTGNVQSAIKQVKPYAVDVSSGVETNGKKDKEKIESFIAAVRRCG